LLLQQHPCQAWCSQRLACGWCTSPSILVIGSNWSMLLVVSLIYSSLLLSMGTWNIHVNTIMQLGTNELEIIWQYKWIFW
jgi:hypothetical protein